MKKCVVMLADGFEEIEALAPVDLLRRAGVEVITVGNELVKGSRGISVASDMSVKDFMQNLTDENLPDAIVVPGGLNGTKNLASCKTAQELITKMWNNKKLVCAICAAPVIVLSPFGNFEKQKIYLLSNNGKGFCRICWKQLARKSFRFNSSN